ncbi:MAG: amidohydrolase family protein [Desulfitobacteriia bacterium]|jgi:predicted TIM-barrel fold metal-dependent hydrolase
MSRRIIDFHTHLGDIFHENKNIAFKRPGFVPDPPGYKGFDPFNDLEDSGYTRPLVVPDIEAMNQLIDAGQVRVWNRANIFTTGELMDKAGIRYVVSLPILPNTSFEEALAASKLDPRFIPFTSPDFGLSDDKMMDKLKADIEKGARGLKLHPIIQNLPITDKRCAGPIELFGSLGKPITYHCGINDYYKGDSPWLGMTNSQYGSLEYTEELFSRYPDFIWIPAHGGGLRGGELEVLAEIKAKKNLKNVYIESSYRGAAGMKQMLELFGEDRIMFGTDWPFDSCISSIKCGEEAFGNDPELADKFFYGNAARLLGLE